MVSMVPFISLLFYLVVLGFIFWFATSLIKSQKEQNIILKEISSKLNNIELREKED